MPKAITVAINYFGVTEFVEGLVPTLANSSAPRVVVVSSMASLQPNSAELVDALLADDEAKALEIGGALEAQGPQTGRSEEHTSELQSRPHLVCRLLLEKKKKKRNKKINK